MRRFLADRRGVALIEFAFALPVLALLYVGGYQLTDAISASRKVTLATRTIADLTSQSTSVTTSDLDSYLTAATQVLAPYKIDASKLVVTQIYIDPKGKATVDWSRGKNSDGLVVGSAFAIPSQISLRQKDSYLIVASIDYTYVPVIAANMIGTINLGDQMLMGPRASDKVTLRS